MELHLEIQKTVLFVASCFALASCAHTQKPSEPLALPTARVEGLAEAKVSGAVLLRLKADPRRLEKVSYYHRSRSTSFEDVEVRHQKEESVEFTSQAETLKVDDKAERFTQVISIAKKDGSANLHDFAMPELGEKLEITADTRGRVFRAGDYPTNSIFYVPPISLPDSVVAVGETWAMQASWLSLDEMVPYQLDMASILKRIWKCGAHQCAEIEISGEVTLQGPLVNVMAFKSLWKGFMLFDIDAGTVAWSRVDSEEQFMSGNVRRSVTSCLEATLVDPTELKLTKKSGPPCASIAAPGDIAPTPSAPPVPR